MDLGLSGRKALVCASSKGLGFATAQSLAREGAELLLCARNADELERAATQIATATGRKPHTQVVDLASPDAVSAFAKIAEGLLKGIDILVNNVGGPPPSPAANTSLDAWRRGFEQLFLGTTLLTTALLPGMRQRRFGRIITITSLSVVEPIEQLVVSTAMRAAVTGFAKTLANEVARDGITVNTVMPGVIHTQRIEQLRQAKAARDGTTLEAEMTRTAQHIPMGRLGRPEELGDLVTFLASERASYITGCNIPIDGGLRKSPF